MDDDARRHGTAVAANVAGVGRCPEPPEKATPGITFPQIARLELDALLEQLVERAQEVLKTQGRLRGLLAATTAISSDLSLGVMLRRITQSACDLLGARYGALGVIGPDQQLTEVITVGFSEETTADIGRQPLGRGLLRSLISDPVPLRLGELGELGCSTGFPPAAHSPMRSFLGVPIRAGDQVFGNLYLTEKAPESAFTAQDEELLTVLASAAGVAIHNARLYEIERRRRRWLTASADVTRELLAEIADPLPLIVAKARETAGADLGTILVPVIAAPEMLLVAAADGAGSAAVSGRLIPRAQSLAGQALAADRDLVLDDVARALEDAAIAGGAHPLADPPEGPALMVRVPAAGEGRAGMLCLFRRRGSPRFDADEQQMVAGFAQQAGVGLELARAQAARPKLLLFEDRDRIARDLQDHVIQRIFAAGLGLTALASRTGEPETSNRLEAHIEQLDATIRAIRQSVFELHRSHEEGVQARVLDLARDAQPLLGFAPELRFDGPLDTMVDLRTGDHVVGVVREALSNTARHARANAVTAHLSTKDGHRLKVTISDDGIGIGRHVRESGLANMRSRAEELGGTCTVHSPTNASGGGTRVEWTVPLQQLGADAPMG